MQNKPLNSQTHLVRSSPVPDNTLGLALSISKNGTILSVIHNGLGHAVEKNTLFPTLFPSEVFGDAMSLLQTLTQHGIVSDVPLRLFINDEIRSLYFTGAKNGDNFIVIGALDQGTDNPIYDELAKVNNELTNALRDAIKREHESENSSDLSLNDFTKLNNELVNTQRELSKSNRLLATLNEEKSSYWASLHTTYATHSAL